LHVIADVGVEIVINICKVRDVRWIELNARLEETALYQRYLAICLHQCCSVCVRLSLLQCSFH